MILWQNHDEWSSVSQIQVIFHQGQDCRHLPLNRVLQCLSTLKQPSVMALRPASAAVSANSVSFAPCHPSRPDPVIASTPSLPPPPSTAAAAAPNLPSQTCKPCSWPVSRRFRSNGTRHIAVSSMVGRNSGWILGDRQVSVVSELARIAARQRVRREEKEEKEAGRRDVWLGQMNWMNRP